MPQNDKTFVSRGGIKLQAALDQFTIDVQGKVVLDVGSSTGGFVDCLLRNGATKVYALDTAYGELAWKLRNDPRVVVMERTNILHLESLPSQNTSDGPCTKYGRESKRLPGGRPSLRSHDSSNVLQGSNEVAKVDLITIDAGWTRLELVLPVVRKFLKPEGKIIALLKPHYEADKKDLIKGVLPVEKAAAIKDVVIKTISDLPFTIENQMESPILGGAGNMEYLLIITSSFSEK